MKFPSFRSISVRLSLRFMIILASSVLILSILFVFVVRSVALESEKRELLRGAQEVARSVETGDYSSVPYFISFLVADSDEKIIATNDPFLPLLPDTNGIVRPFFEKGFFLDGDLKIRYVSFFSGKNKIIAAVNTDGGVSEKLSFGLPFATIFAVLPVLLLSFLMSLFITRSVLSRVEKLTKSAQRISSENLGELLLISGTGDELDSLSSAFNSLFVRLKADFERERQFTSDVSHELKTPVAVILGQANLLLRWGKNEPEQLEKSLNAIRREARSMDAIISNLLTLSRLERGIVFSEKEVVDIRALLLRVREEFFHVYPKISIQIEGAAIAKTNGEMLHQVFTAVISNSAKYAGEECHIFASVEKKAERVCVILRDNGAGFPENALPFVFDRFFRADESHSRTGGSGLGLSIVRAIIEQALGGKISARNANEGGAEIEIALPIL